MYWQWKFFHFIISNICYFSVDNLSKNAQQHDESETPQGAMADPLMVDLSGIPSENKDEDYEEKADATADDEESYSSEGSANTSMDLSLFQLRHFTRGM